MANRNRTSTGRRLVLLLSAATAVVCFLASPGASEEATASEDPWQQAPAGAEAAAERDEDRVIGRVVGVRGKVYAQTPGKERRLLTENAPIFPGDRIVTANGAQIGVLSGEYYTSLHEDTTLTYSKRGGGAPEVKLERGDVRVINAGDGDNARIATPGMLATTAGSDTRAVAVQEKAWMVSLVCALEGQVQVQGAGGGLTVNEGGCAASKPAEGLFLAAAAPAVLPVGAPGPAVAGAAGAADAAGDVTPFNANGDPVVGDAAQRFVDPVAAAPPGFVNPLAARPGIQTNDNALDVIQPCDAGNCARGLPGPILVPPAVNPWVGGRLRR